jgi:hypothetical protein
MRRDSSMGLIENIQPPIDIEGPITKKKLVTLTELVLQRFDGNMVAMLQSYGDFCVSNGAKANRYTHFEWACGLLGIKTEKTVKLS